jgi:hypothetical protein
MIPFIFTTNGPLIAGQDLDAPLYPGIRGEITQIAAYCKTGGEGDPLVFDVRKNGSSLFAQAVKRPRLLPGGSNRIDLTPRQDFADRQLTMISTLSVHVLQAPTVARAEDARVIVWFEPTAERGMPFCFSVNGMLANGLLDAPIFPGMSGTIDRISVCAKAAAALSVPIAVQVQKNGQPVCESIDLTLTGNYDTAEVMLFQPLTRNDLLSCILTGAPEAAAAELSVMVWVI